MSRQRTFRIAMIAACPFPCARGTPVRIFRLAEALTLRGHDVRVVAYHHGDQPGRMPFRVERIPSVPFYRDLAPGPTYTKLLLLDPLLQHVLRRSLRREPVDLVHAHHYEGLLVALAAGRARSTLIYDAHTTLSSELPSYRLGLPGVVKRSAGALLDQHLPLHADHTIAVTTKIRLELIARGVVPDRISVVTNGVEIETFNRQRAEAGLHPPTLIYAGTLAVYQRIDLLLKAFARIRAARPDARLIVATDSPFDFYDGLASRLGVRDAIVLEPGDFAALPELLSRADVAISPRVVCAGIPQKLLNYMAAGKPVVSFAGSGVVIDHERTGLLVADGDVEELARSAIRLLDDPAARARMGLAGREKVAQELTWEHAARRVEAIYEEALARHAGVPATHRFVRHVEDALAQPPTESPHAPGLPGTDGHLAGGAGATGRHRR